MKKKPSNCSKANSLILYLTETPKQRQS